MHPGWRHIGDDLHRSLRQQLVLQPGGAAEVAKHGSFGTVLTVEIEGDQLRVVDFPLPTGLAEVEEPFHQWAVQTHPRSAPLMWDTGGPSIESRIRLDGAGGTAHQALLDDYVDYLRATTRHSPG